MGHLGPQMARDFVDRGWVVVDLDGTEVVAGVADQLLARLRSTSLPQLDRLEDYHRHVVDDAHDDVHHELAEWYWEAGLGRCIVDAELGFLRALVGLDLHVQRYPYLRVARPGEARDVTGIHRDTDYGASAYEVSMVVPFTRMGEEGALRVVSGSHLDPPERYPATRVESESVTPGSSRHRLGFPYAPQVLDDDVVQRAEPVAVEVGQALVMSLGLVHGQALNAGTTTRFSTDVRVVNSLAPVAFARGVRADYYVPLCESPVTEQARRHAGLPDC
jgi:hypothetical protein